MQRRSCTVGNFAAKARSTQPLGRQHHVHGHVDFSLESFEQAFGLCAEPVDSVRDGPRFAEHGSTCCGKHGPARAMAHEQLEPKLRFQIVDPIADHRNRTVQFTRGTGETSGIDDCQEDPKLLKGGGAWSRHFQCSRYELPFHVQQSGKRSRASSSRT
jgi:hypothetical protein